MKLFNIKKLGAILFLFAFLAVTINGIAKKPTKILFTTTKGDIKITLYDEKVPVHAANFKKLVKEGYFNGTLFHRVIKDFMIQGGDPDSKTAAPGVLLGNGGPSYTLAPEFRLPEIIHRRGVLAAAREGDDVNPKKESSASQFYIVWGKIFDEAGLDAQQKKMDKRSGGTIKLTPEMREVYKTTGGTPHLDGQYTIFGEVLDGMDVVDTIQNVKTDKNDRPVEDVRIISAKIVRKF
jgi:cyclophilin family peptidyl-prolyl cis-trans isomerase